jgi:hypothetical protein
MRDRLDPKVSLAWFLSRRPDRPGDVPREPLRKSLRLGAAYRRFSRESKETWWAQTTVPHEL